MGRKVMSNWKGTLVYLMCVLASVDICVGAVEEAKVLAFTAIACGLVCVASAIDGKG